MKKYVLMSVIIFGVVSTAHANPGINDPHKKCLFHGTLVDLVFPTLSCDFSPYYGQNAHSTQTAVCEGGNGQLEVCTRSHVTPIPHDPDCFEESVFNGIFL